MGRKLLMVALGLGAVAGFGSGFARLAYGGFGHHGAACGFGRHAEMERRIADACTESALRVYGRAGDGHAGPKP